MKLERKYSVWVGGTQVHDYLLTREEAKKLAQEWANEGYDDVVIDNGEIAR
jgi:hypothetical protein